MNTNYLLVVLVLAGLFSAIAQVEFIHLNRKKVQLWQKQMNLQVQLEQEYSRLLLEKNTLVSPARVDALAKRKLGLISPEKIRVVN